MIRKEDVADVYPLTPFQEGLLFTQWQEEAGTRADRAGPAAYSMQIRFRLTGPLSKSAFDRAWQDLVDRHDILRTAFPKAFKDRPLQILLKKCPLSVSWEKVDAADAQRRDEILVERALRTRQVPLKLDTPPLMRLTGVCFADDDHGVIWDFHHILMDGWCIGIFQEELPVLYEAALSGKPAVLPPVLSYSKYVAWIEARRHDATPAKWAPLFEGANPRAVSLPGQKSAAHASARQTQTCQRELGQADVHALKALAGVHRCTWSDVLHALWGVFMGRLNAGRDVLFGSVRAVRPVDLPNVQGMVGPCIGMVPVRVNWDTPWTLEQLLAGMAAQRTLWQAYAAESLPEILQSAGLPRDALTHFLVVENYPAIDDDPEHPQPLAAGVTMSDWQFWALNEYDFFVRISPTHLDGLRIEFEFDAERFDAATLDTLVDCFARLLTDAANRPGLPLDRLAMMDCAQTELVLNGWGCGPEPVGVSKDFVSLWHGLVSTHGQRPALRWGTQALTYVELHALAAAVASDLRQRGAGHVDVVALPALPGPWLACGMVACALLGLPFLPLDPQWPQHHRRRVLQDSGARWRFGPVPADWREDGICDVIPPDAAPLAPPAKHAAAAFDDMRVQFRPHPDATAYIIYTSGTTGLPKGVAVGMGSLLNYTAWLRETWQIGPDSASALLTSAAYDLGYTALFGTLFNGGCLTVLDEEQRRDPDVVVQTVIDHKLTFLKATPSYFSMLQSSEAWQALSPADHRLTRVFLGGEPQNFADLAELHSKHPQVRVHNHYGPTEATIGCISGELASQISLGQSAQVLGRPIPGAVVRIVDAGLQPVPAGVSGEMLLGGDILAQGYCGAAASLTPDRFLEMPGQPGQRLYRTGDFAAWTPDGQVVFLGRRDDQVKVQGYRVQLGDLTAAVLRLPRVSDAAVLAEGVGTSQTLVAFVVPRGDGFDSAHCRQLLLQSVPQALVPGRWVLVDTIPLTSNGKIDRARLLALAAQAARPPDVSMELHASPTELQILEAFRSVLSRPDFGLHDDFFGWGGHSLKSIRLVSALRRVLGRPVPISAVFDHPSPAALAKWLSRHDPVASDLLHSFTDSAQPKYDMVFFPTLLGSAVLFQKLAAALPAHARCWGIHCPEPGTTTAHAPSLRTFAELMAVAIEQGSLLERRYSDASRPLVLVGWSFGAYLAYETACTLLRRSGSISLKLVLIDIPPPAAVHNSTALEPLTIDAVKYDVRRAGILVGDEEIESLMPVIALHSRLLHEHRATMKVNADVLALEASDGSPRAQMQGWREWTHHRLVCSSLPGDHYDVVAPGAQESLAAVLDAWGLGTTIPVPQTATRG